MSQASNMPKQFRNIKLQFDQVSQGTTTLRSRFTSCGEDINNMMGFAVAKLYKDKYFDTTARNEVFQIK
jgi:predicted metalloendopeptidase